MLTPHVEAIVHQLLPAGRNEGGYFRVGSLAGEPGQSLCVYLQGAKRGWWRDYAGTDAGDIIELIAQAAYGGDKAEAIKYARSFLGLSSMTPGQFKQARRKAVKQAEEAQLKEQERDDNRRRQARAVWLSAEPMPGTPAEYYLRDRGINFDVMGKMPGALRYAHCWQREKKTKLPCMVAAINDVHGNHIATHRTWIIRDGQTWRSAKAELQDEKLTLGKYHKEGGFISLSKGVIGGKIQRGKMNDMAEGQDIYISEGIEDGLTIAMVNPAARVIAAVALNNIGQIPIPPQAGNVVLIGQHDGEDSTAFKALEKAIGEQQKAAENFGRVVKVIWPDPEYKDFNDQLRGIKKQSVQKLSEQE